MTQARLTPTPDGPYLVTGPLEIVDGHGRELDSSAETVYLCRCGYSGNKPFCDGSHERIGWKEQT